MCFRNNKSFFHFSRVKENFINHVFGKTVRTCSIYCYKRNVAFAITLIAFTKNTTRFPLDLFNRFAIKTTTQKTNIIDTNCFSIILSDIWNCQVFKCFLFDGRELWLCRPFKPHPAPLFHSIFQHWRVLVNVVVVVAIPMLQRH